LRSCAENENYLRGERGDSELTIDKIMGIIEMPESYKNHLEVKSETLLFNNPSLKKCAQFNPFYENAIEYNLQPFSNLNNDHNSNKNMRNDSNYANELYNRLPLSVYDNLAIRDLDNYSKHNF
jgi:hypothetical protein